MKKNTILLSYLKVLSISISILFFSCAKNNITVSISNSLNNARPDELVILKRDSLERITGKIPDNKTLLIENVNGDYIASQTDDLNNDGRWDELAFLINLKPKEETKIIVSQIDKKDVPFFQKRAHALLRVSRKRNDHFVNVKEEERPKDHQPQSTPMLYQFEGPGWENDKIAFRSYFDSRNGKDIFGKLIPKIVLDSVGLPGKSYHEIANWGMDILKVGNSLGAGALAIKHNGVLFRLGQTTTAHYKLISDGPVRAIFKLDYSGWVIEADTLTVHEQISIWGGKNYYLSKVELSSKSGIKYNLVTGISTVHLMNENYKPEFRKINKDFSYLAVKNDLSENKDLLAMGILVNNKYIKEWAQSPAEGKNGQIVKTAYLTFKDSFSNAIEFRFFAGWEKADERFKKDTLLNKIMIDEAELLTNPVIINYRLSK